MTTCICLHPMDAHVKSVMVPAGQCGFCACENAQVGTPLQQAGLLPMPRSAAEATKKGRPSMDEMPMMKPASNAVTDQDEIGELLDEAEDAYPSSDFVGSVREWFEEKGWITQRQWDALERIAKR